MQGSCRKDRALGHSEMESDYGKEGVMEMQTEVMETRGRGRGGGGGGRGRKGRVEI